VHTPPRLALRMLRYESKYFGKDLEAFTRDHIVMVERLDQTAASRLIVDGERVALTQDFREGGFCSKSAVAAAIVGGPRAGRVCISGQYGVRGGGIGLALARRLKRLGAQPVLMGRNAEKLEGLSHELRAPAHRTSLHSLCQRPAVGLPEDRRRSCGLLEMPGMRYRFAAL